MLTIEMSTTRFLLRKYDIIEQINSRDLAVGDTTVLLLQESSHLVPLLLQESSLHFLSFFVKTFLVYFYLWFVYKCIVKQRRSSITVGFSTEFCAHGYLNRGRKLSLARDKHIARPGP